MPASSYGLYARGRKGGLAADHTSPLRRIVEEIWSNGGIRLNANGTGDTIHHLTYRLECGHVIPPAQSGLLAVLDRRPKARRRCYMCAKEATDGL